MSKHDGARRPFKIRLSKRYLGDYRKRDWIFRKRKGKFLIILSILFYWRFEKYQRIQIQNPEVFSLRFFIMVKKEKRFYQHFSSSGRSFHYLKSAFYFFKKPLKLIRGANNSSYLKEELKGITIYYKNSPSIIYY